MTPMSPTNPFEESTNPFESDLAADARSSSQPQVEVWTFAENFVGLCVCLRVFHRGRMPTFLDGPNSSLHLLSSSLTFTFPSPRFLFK